MMNHYLFQASHDPRQSVLDTAKKYDLALEMKDFEYVDGEWTIDGMPTRQWLNFMLSE